MIIKRNAGGALSTIQCIHSFASYVLGYRNGFLVASIPSWDVNLCSGFLEGLNEVNQVAAKDDDPTEYFSI